MQYIHTLCPLLLVGNPGWIKKEHNMTEIDSTCQANATEISYAASSRLGRGYDGCTTFAGTS